MLCVWVEVQAALTTPEQQFPGPLDLAGKSGLAASLSGAKMRRGSASGLPAVPVGFDLASNMSPSGAVFSPAQQVACLMMLAHVGEGHDGSLGRGGVTGFGEEDGVECALRM